MANSPNPLYVQTGTINNGATPIQADVSAGLSPAAAVYVTLSTNYATLCPPGWPQRPQFTGAGAQGVDSPETILSGTRILLLAPEANALVLAGAASYS